MPIRYMYIYIYVISKQNEINHHKPLSSNRLRQSQISPMTSLSQAAGGSTNVWAETWSTWSRKAAAVSLGLSRWVFLLKWQATVSEEATRRLGCAAFVPAGWESRKIHDNYANHHCIRVETQVVTHPVHQFVMRILSTETICRESAWFVLSKTQHGAVFWDRKR